MPGGPNNICLHDYYYSLEEIAELFEGKMKGKIIHFANLKVLDLNDEEAQYFLDITGARAISTSSTNSSLISFRTSLRLQRNWTAINSLAHLHGWAFLR